MPNAILRAGPFANTTGNSFLDQPVSASSSTFPVNCADSAWINDDWKSYVKTTKTISTGAGFISVENYQNGPTLEVNVSSDGVIQNPNGTEPEESFVKFIFAYQAAVDFTLRFTATVTRLSGGAHTEVSSGFLINGTEVSLFNTQGTPTTVTHDLTCSASVVPSRVTAEIDSLSPEGTRSNSLLKVQPIPS
tara:strand:+ start:95 stop:667 length:573 start_codon:yes stop_codon:yes gene_type:complete